MPRQPLGHLPTPLEPMVNLAADLGLAAAWVKRDDCTGLAFGGNKVRQVEFYIGAAAAAGADTVLITGAVQSNFVRTVAAAAARAGMQAHVQLEERVATADPTYRQSGNVLLDHMLGAVIHTYPDGEDEAGADARLDALADRLRRQGRTPYVIHLAPVHPPVGALGYVDAGRETVAQLAAAGIALDGIVVPSGSGATHAGYLVGLRAAGCRVPVTGICVRRPAEQQIPRIRARCAAIAALLEIDNPVGEADVVIDDAALAPGYGRFSPAVTAAIALAARREALLLDPVYTGKAMAGFIALAGRLGSGARLLFLHTGGGPGIFAYGPALAAALAAAPPASDADARPDGQPDGSPDGWTA